MGNPRNYSLELPDRCLALIYGLWDGVLRAKGHAERYGGPLTNTFLLAMATPMILLPVERILNEWDGDRSADDRPLDPATVSRLHEAFDRDPSFGAAAFFHLEDGWSYVFVADRFNIARGLPDELAVGLTKGDAFTAVASLDAMEAMRAIRNVLSHGGVGFLNQDGFSSHGEISTMLAIVGEKTVRRKLEGCHVLRISETGFRSFLHRWVKWLNDSCVAEAMAT